MFFADRPDKTQSGFALLIVLWSLVLISFLVTRVMKNAHDDILIALNVRRQAEQQAIADGAIFDAAFHLRDGGSGHWRADSRIHRYMHRGNVVSVAMTDEAGKINLNTAPLGLLRDFLLIEGVDAVRATGLANAIIDWRDPGDIANGGGSKSEQYRAAGKNYGPPGSFFRQLDELNLVLGVTPDLSARLTPHLTLFSTYGPTADTTDAVIAALLRKQNQIANDYLQDGDYQPVDVVSINVTVENSDGHRATRWSVVKFDRDVRGAHFNLLSWNY